MHYFGYLLAMSTVCAELDPGAYMGCIRLSLSNQTVCDNEALCNTMSSAAQTFGKLDMAGSASPSCSTSQDT
jgi:hypothetical protein